VRPSGYEGKKLPVAFWIHGGTFVNGGGADQRYNLSFIVEQSVTIGKPIIAVSINYRLSLWGFASSKELQADGALNIGLRDQRLAMHWVQENIKAFGGMILLRLGNFDLRVDANMHDRRSQEGYHLWRIGKTLFRDRGRTLTLT
jgi:hypothetical protein